MMVRRGVTQLQMLLAAGNADLPIMQRVKWHQKVARQASREGTACFCRIPCPGCGSSHVAPRPFVTWGCRGSGQTSLALHHATEGHRLSAAMLRSATGQVEVVSGAHVASAEGVASLWAPVRHLLIACQQCSDAQDVLGCPEEAISMLKEGAMLVSTLQSYSQALGNCSPWEICLLHTCRGSGTVKGHFAAVGMHLGDTASPFRCSKSLQQWWCAWSGYSAGLQDHAAAGTSTASSHTG